MFTRLVERSPLIYLAAHQMVNTLRKTATSARRLVSYLVIAGYFVFVMVQMMTVFGDTAAGPTGLVTVPQAVGLAFIAFSALWLINIMTITSGLNPIAMAEVEVLFPSPIDPRRVLRYKIIRGMVSNLLLPILFRAMYAVEMLRHPSSLHLAGTSLSVVIDLALAVYVLMVAAAQVWSHAFSLRFKRDVPGAPKLLIWITYGLYTIFGVALILVAILVRLDGVSVLYKLGSIPYLEVVFFPAVVAQRLVLAPITGWGMGLAALLFFIGFFALGWRLAMEQVGWLYDIDSQRGAKWGAIIDAMRKGNTAGLIQSMAQSGKIKARGQGLADRIRVQGLMSFVWREIILFMRQRQPMGAFLLILAACYTAFPFIFFKGHGGHALGAVIAILGAQVAGVVYASLMNVQTGVAYFLQLTDLLKPLGFSARQIVFIEMVSKGWIGATIVPLVSLVMIFVRPACLPYAAPLLLFAPPISFLMAGSHLFSYLVMPDRTDMAQRTLRGFVSLPVMLVSFGIPAGFMALGWFALGPTVGGILGGVAGYGTAFLLAAWAAKLYENFVYND